MGTALAGRYRLDRTIGSGGCGVVWAATDLETGAVVAVKLMKEQAAEAQRRFAIETKILENLSHPRCVRLLASGSHGSVPFLVTEYVPGIDLGTWLETSPTEQARRIVAGQLAEGLRAAHRQGIIHRDLKPQNVMISDTRQGPQLKILDFGISRLAGAHPSDVTKTGEINGTPGYMSPEQLRAKRVDPSSDIYSLGTIFYELFEGRHPFTADTAMALCMAHLSAPPRPFERMPEDLRDLVAAMLAKKADDRPTLQAICVQLGLRPAPARAAVSNGPDSRRWLIGAGALATAAVAAVVAVAMRTPEPVAPPLAARRQDPSALLTPATTPDPIEPSSPAADAGTQTDAATDAALVPHHGCGIDVAPGVNKIFDNNGYNLWAYVPQSYEPTTPSPAIWVIHDFGITAERLARFAPLQQHAEQSGSVLLMPNDASFGSVWTKNHDAERLRAVVEAVDGELCLDPNRRFVLGIGSGGSAIRRLSCSETFTAAATVGYRFTLEDRTCEGTPRPLLAVSATDDAAAPADGGSPCWSFDLPGIVEGDKVVSLAEQETLLREAADCKGPIRAADSSVEGLRCETATCATPLVWCRASGGRYLPSMLPDPNTIVGMQDVISSCGQPIDVDPLDQVWSFFEAHDPGRRSQ